MGAVESGMGVMHQAAQMTSAGTVVTHTGSVVSCGAMPETQISAVVIPGRCPGSRSDRRLESEEVGDWHRPAGDDVRSIEGVVSREDLGRISRPVREQELLGGGGRRWTTPR